MRKIKFTALSIALAIAAVGACPTTAITKTKKAQKNSTPQVIVTGELAKKVSGYNGPTPVSISISNGKITSITALDNQETPAYFNKAKQKVFGQFIGKTVDEALKLDADAATGATYSSEALIKNIKMGLQQAKGDAKDSSSKKKSNSTAKKKTSKGKKRMTR